tara:strand:- start:179 stop:340 length:162 start_codon:yes stop_codon:yes gene_type:complete
MSNVKGGKSIDINSGKTEPGNSVNAEPYNPFTKDGKTRKGDRTPTSSSLNTGP